MALQARTSSGPYFVRGMCRAGLVGVLGDAEADRHAGQSVRLGPGDIGRRGHPQPQGTSPWRYRPSHCDTGLTGPSPGRLRLGERRGEVRDGIPGGLTAEGVRQVAIGDDHESLAEDGADRPGPLLALALAGSLSPTCAFSIPTSRRAPNRWYAEQRIRSVVLPRQDGASMSEGIS